MHEPRILTLAVEDDTQRRWDAARRAHFPADRLVVGAHVTLFHALPAALDLDDDLARATDRAAFEVAVAEVVPLGRGVAYRLDAPDLTALHAGLQDRWHAHLTRQDRQRLRAHVTVQNKVTPEVARATLQRLERDFEASTTTALGLDLWRYDGGPWAHLHRYAFAA